MRLLELDHQSHTAARHDYAEGLVVARGEINLIVDGEEIAVHTGGTFVIPAGALHTVAGGGSSTVLILD
jgi:quercetin dioxygenase-like cupin family protein